MFRFLALLCALFAAIAVAVNPVEIKGQDFVDSVTGKRLMIIGADYQPGGQAGYKPQEEKDALTNGTVCLRDAALMQRLGVNTIRVYNVDPTLNHDECASIFNAAGIYMIIDVNSPLSGESINRAEPWTSYHEDYLARTFGVVENFKNYPNTLAFFAANEVMNDMETGEFNPQYIRAVQRDLKNYIKNHSERYIPVGYSAADVREILHDTWAYFECDHDDDNSSSDFFGLNSYSWCGGDATFESSGFDELVDMFQNSSIPVFFSEYGCNEVQPRVFNEVQALYGDEMLSLSGGLVYEYSQEEADYGLVLINDNATVTLRTDFDNFQSQLNELDVDRLTSLDPRNTDLTPPKCERKLIENDAFSNNFTLPAVCPGCSDLIKNGISNPVEGKLVDVSETNVPMAVYGSNGGEVQNLALRILSNDASNVPGGETTSPEGSGSGSGSGSGNGSASGSGSDDTGAASMLTSGPSVLIALFVGLLTLL